MCDACQLLVTGYCLAVFLLLNQVWASGTFILSHFYWIWTWILLWLYFIIKKWLFILFIFYHLCFHTKNNDWLDLQYFNAFLADKHNGSVKSFKWKISLNVDQKTVIWIKIIPERLTWKWCSTTILESLLVVQPTQSSTYSYGQCKMEIPRIQLWMTTFVYFNCDS